MSLVPVKEYTSAAEIYAARRALRAQFYTKPARKPAPAVPAVVQVELRPEVISEREQAIRDWLSLASPESLRASTGALVLNIISAHTGFERSALVGATRHAPLVRARQMAYWLIRRHTGLSLPSIGQRLGGRDHTTVLSGCRKVERLMAGDQDFAALVRMLSAEVEAKTLEGREL